MSDSILEVMHDMAKDLTDAGLMDVQTMAKAALSSISCACQQWMSAMRQGLRPSGKRLVVLH
jgi:hypothetical protein